MKRAYIVAAVVILAASLVATSCEDVTKSIEDQAFAEWCRTNLDSNGNGRISDREAAAVEEISVPACGIASLKGLELFPELKSLNCSGNKLTELDLRGNPSLVHLDCQSNELTGIIFADADIENLACSGNDITSLDVSGLKSLKSLYCGGNAMETLILGEKPQLNTLSCYDNCLKELDLSACPALETLDCRANELESLDLTACPCLTRTLGLSFNNITVLDLSENPGVRGVDCDKDVSVKGAAPEVEISRY